MQTVNLLLFKNMLIITVCLPDSIILFLYLLNFEIYNLNKSMLTLNNLFNVIALLGTVQVLQGVNKYRPLGVIL